MRVQAWNKAVGGTFSKAVTIATPAFNFSLDPEACHANLKVTGPLTVEWDAAPVKSKCRVEFVSVRLLRHN